MTRDRRILERHFQKWRDRGLVSPELEDALRRASEEEERGGASAAGRVALAFLGGGLLLAGLILVIAENWQAIHRFVKLGGWALLQVGFLAAAHRFERKWLERPYFAETFTLIASGWIFAGIVLVSQIYHLTSRPPNGIWLWLALLSPGVWILRQRAVSLAFFIALLAALALEVGEKDSWVYAREAESPWLWLAIPLLAAASASFLPHPVRWLRELVGVWVFATSTIFLLVFGGLQELDESDLGRAWLVAAAGLAAGLLLPGRVLPAAWAGWPARTILLLTLIPWALVGAQYEGVSALDDLAVGVSWVTQLAVSIVVIRSGAAAGSTAWVNLGYLALLGGILTRYFDFFGEYLRGGTALALTGVLLLFVLYAIEKSRRRTLQQGLLK